MTNNDNPPMPLNGLTTTGKRPGLRAFVVDLPEADFLTCLELAHVIADALVRPFGNAGRSYPKERAAWIDPSAKTPYPRSRAARLLVQRLRQYRGAPYSSKWDPSMELLSPVQERWLIECAHRQQDLQAWVSRKELSIFTASRTKAQSVGPGTYLRRVDAIRYCEESGLQVKSQFQPVPPASAPAQVRFAETEHRSSYQNNEDATSSAALPAPAPPRPSTRLLRTKEAIARIGLSRSSFYERLNPNSPYFDSTFPAPVQIGQSAMGYREDELDAWIASRPEKKR